MADRIILGIGNPGAEYALTRHNVGWMVLDRLLAGRDGFTKRGNYQLASWRYASDCTLRLVKPLTYVNCSGRVAQAVCSFYKVHPANLLVVSDDIHLALGTLRLRAEGSHGGHNGLRDIIAHLGQQFPRLRVGVGKPTPGMDQVAHVLGRFPAESAADLHATLDRCCDCIESWIRDGVNSAMRYNGPLHPPAARSGGANKSGKKDPEEPPLPSPTDQGK